VLIAAPLLLVGGSWQEITAGPTATDVAAPADPADSADSDQAGDDDDAIEGGAAPPVETDTGDPAETTPTQPSSRQGEGAEENVP
jgi:hypothetical protein